MAPESEEVIVLLAPIDAHLHLRQGAITAAIAGWSSCCDAVVVMPNTKPPIHDYSSIRAMREHYQRYVGPATTVHMTAKWLQTTAPRDVVEVDNASALGLKLYPQGRTTNAEDGIPFERFANFRGDALIADVLGELERRNLVLLCHGEAPGFCLDRENLFLPALGDVMRAYPKLRVTLEHITTRAGLAFVETMTAAGHRMLGTITIHHMLRTLDNVIGGKLEPDEFCMPIPKRDEDMLALRAAAISGRRAIALGTDSAPHPASTKYCAHGCAGVFSACPDADACRAVRGQAGRRLPTLLCRQRRRFLWLEAQRQDSDFAGRRQYGSE